jgi:hypothetical protein
MGTFFELGGFTMWPILAFGALTILAAGAFAVSPDAKRAGLALAAGLLTLLTGAMGTALGFVVTLTSMGAVPPETRFIAMIGVGESLTNFVLASGLCALAAMLGVIGAGRRAMPGLFASDHAPQDLVRGAR